MEKTIRTKQGGHIVITYHEACDPNPLPDPNGVKTYTPYNQIKVATLYGVDANSGKTVRIDIPWQDLNDLVVSVNSIHRQVYPAMTEEQFNAYVSE